MSDFPKFLLTAGANQQYSNPVPPPFEGRFAIVTDAGRDAVDAGGAKDEGAVLRTAKSCGPDTPTLVSSRWKQFRRRRWQKSPVAGESAIYAVNHCAGSAG